MGTWIECVMIIFWLFLTNLWPVFVHIIISSTAFVSVHIHALSDARRDFIIKKCDVFLSFAMRQVRCAWCNDIEMVLFTVGDTLGIKSKELRIY